MSRTDEKIAAIERLMTGYGTFAALPDVRFDEDGLLSFRFDDVDLTLSLAAGKTEIVVRSALDLRQTTIRPALLANVLAANMITLQGGMGVVGIDTDAGSWVWADRFDPADMTPEDLHGRLNEAARAVRFWRARIAALAADERRSAPRIDEPFTMIRI